MLKRILTLFVITTFAFVLASCGKKASNKETTGIAYGITHSDYVGVATVKVKNQLVTAAGFEEYFLPNTWAKVKTLNTEEVPADIVVEGATWYGKYLVIGSKRFTGQLRSEPLVIDGKTYSKQTVKYSAEGIEDLFIWLYEKEDNRKWYIEELDKGNAYVADSSFKKSNYETAGLLNSDGKLGFTKSSTNYWKGESFPLGWQGNMQEIVKVIIGTKMNVTMDNIVKGQDNYWVVGGVKSGATLNDFKDYYAIAQAAYNKALAIA